LPGRGVISSMYVNKTTNGVITLWHDSAAAVNTGKIISTSLITPAVGYHYLGNLDATAGLYVGVPQGTIDVTFHVKSSD